jgi:aspartate-semialdehyde dehydrogenase
MESRTCAIVGATGPAGQKLAAYLDKHPFLELRAVVASETSAGKKFRDAIVPFFGKLDCPLPNNTTLNMRVQNLDNFKPKDYNIIFSTLDSDVAAEYEAGFAKYTPVFTAAGANRYAPLVPIHNVSVNDEHIAMIERQQRKLGRNGFISAKSNCTTAPIVSILRRISEYGIEYVSVYTEQALSGAGKKGLDGANPYRQMLRQVKWYPYIEGENDKVTRESREILGSLDSTSLTRLPADFRIDALCTRVDRDNVHDERILIVTKKDFKLLEIIEMIVRPNLQYQLYIFPKDPVVLWSGFVTPSEHVARFGPMRIAVGEIKKPAERNLLIRVTTDNTGLGAGLGLIASAEYYAMKNVI